MCNVTSLFFSALTVICKSEENIQLAVTNEELPLLCMRDDTLKYCKNDSCMNLVE